jgi:hypothetical protein
MMLPLALAIVAVFSDAFCAKRQGASADKLHVKAANILSSPDSSKTQSTVGTVLSIHIAPCQPGRLLLQQ